MAVEKNLQLMKTFDDAWNAQDRETCIRKGHAENVAVYRPGRPEPTEGREDHYREAVEFSKTFPDNHVKNDPYNVIFGQAWVDRRKTSGVAKKADIK